MIVPLLFVFVQSLGLSFSTMHYLYACHFLALHVIWIGRRTG